MKIYVVTEGSYSEYAIEKIFSNRPAAEEYKKWHRIYNEIEEWEVNDTFSVDPGTEAVMSIAIEGDVYEEGVVDITYEIHPFIISDTYQKRHTYISRQHSIYFTLRIYRYVAANKWDEEVWKEKMKKALYDAAGIAKAMFAEGATKDDVYMALNNLEEE